MLREDRFVTRLIVLFALFQLAAAGWDLPSSFGWENDGIAPRDLFGGLAFNLTPGQGHRYPLLHYLVVAVISLPFLLLAVLRSESLNRAHLEQQVLAVDVMTGVSAVAKLLAIAAACISVLLLARMARRAFNRQDARWAALWAVTCLSFTYYGRTSNLDGPYLMWTALSLSRLPDLLQRGRWRDYALFAVFAAASVATKDQAYAAYALTCPLYLLLLPALLPRRFATGRAHWRRLLGALGVGAATLGLLGGGLLNPTGFVTRIRILTGGNTQDWSVYSRDLSGLLANLHDLGIGQLEWFWPWPLVGLAWMGVGIALRPHPLRHLRLLPITAGLSAILTFTLVVARSEHRFALPLGFWLAFYGGAASDILCSSAASASARLLKGSDRAIAARLLRLAVPLVLWSLLLLAGWRAAVLALTQWGDARRQVERYLLSVRPDTVVETYGLLVYLPRFDTSAEAPYRVQHVGREQVVIPGVRRINDPYSLVSERNPDLLVIPEHYVERYLPGTERSHRPASGRRREHRADREAVDFFRKVMADSLPGYRLVLAAGPRLPGWAVALGAEPIRIHGSTGMRMRVLERVAAAER